MRGSHGSPEKRDGRSAVPLLEGEDEEEDEEQHERVLEALVGEWLMHEFETILQTNRFHMKVTVLLH